MAAPTVPTADTLVKEALQKAGFSSPTSAQKTRAKDFWLEEIKNDIWSAERRLKSLYTTQIAMLTKGRSRYALPTDFWAELNLTLLFGSTTGTAQAGADNAITLASAESITGDSLIGKQILINSGTGAASIAQATAYNESTKVATTTPTWATNPASGSGYMVVDNYHNLQRSYIWELDKDSQFTRLRRPDSFYMVGDSNEGEFILDAAPDKAYGAQLRHYVDLMEVDLSSTLIATLYQRWRNVWLNGVVWKSRMNEDDSPGIIVAARNEYLSALGGYDFAREAWGGA